jgi:hypothetical protein
MEKRQSSSEVVRKWILELIFSSITQFPYSLYHSLTLSSLSLPRRMYNDSWIHSDRLHNGDVLCFLWGTNWIYICYIEESRPPLWSSGQSSWLQIQRSGFGFRRYRSFWEVVGLERGPLSLVSTTEELLGRKNSGSGLENRDYGFRDPSNWPHGTLYQQKVGTNFHRQAAVAR